MSDFKVEARYDKEKNISFIRFVNSPQTKEDVEYAVEQFLPVWKGDGIHKSWNITDTSGIGMAKPKLVIYYNKLSKFYINKYLEDYTVIANSTLEKVATRLFNVFMGERHTVVGTMNEAIRVIEDWQKEKGVLPSLIKD